jgi:hypothetical protein
LVMQSWKVLKQVVSFRQIQRGKKVLLIRIPLSHRVVVAPRPCQRAGWCTERRNRHCHYTGGRIRRRGVLLGPCLRIRRNDDLVWAFLGTLITHGRLTNCRLETLKLLDKIKRRVVNLGAEAGRGSAADWKNSKKGVVRYHLEDGWWSFRQKDFSCPRLMGRTPFKAGQGIMQVI